MLKESAAGYGVVPLDQARTMDGLALMTGVMNGTFPAPPISKALGFSISEVEAGRVVFVYEPVFDHYNPLGSVHGGIVEIKVNYVRAMTHKTGQVRAEGKVINVGSRIATSEGRLVDGAGKLLAHGTTTCLIFPI